jgi:hypothetical protein
MKNENEESQRKMPVEGWKPPSLRTSTSEFHQKIRIFKNNK